MYTQSLSIFRTFIAKNLSTGAQATLGNFVPGPSRKLVLLFFFIRDFLRPYIGRENAKSRFAYGFKKKKKTF